MNIEYYPKKISVDRVKYNEPMIALIDFNGENAIIAPFIEVETHTNLLRKAICEFESISEPDLNNYFQIFFDKDVADWSFSVPKNYKVLDDKDDKSKQYYLDGFNTISLFLKEINFLIGINIPRKFRL